MIKIGQRGVIKIKMTKELWEKLDSIDGETVIEGAELENWQRECRYQAANHPDPKARATFEAAAKRTFTTRKHARLIAWMAFNGEPCEDCIDD